jgi:predicted nucleotidyltransferase
MTLLFKFPVSRPRTATMRSAAQSVGVEWDETGIVYEGNAVGYADAPDNADPVPIQDELEAQVGIRPSVVA